MAFSSAGSSPKPRPWSVHPRSANSQSAAGPSRCSGGSSLATCSGVSPAPVARLLVRSAPGRDRALQGGGGGVTQRLHVRVGQRNGADLLHQSPMLLRDPGKAIGKLRLVDRLLVENFEEPGDGLDREAAVAGDDLVQPDKQHRAISGGGRCGKLHQPREPVRRQAAEDGGRAHAARCTERTVGLHAVAEPLRQGREAATAFAISTTRNACRGLMTHSAPSGG